MHRSLLLPSSLISLFLLPACLVGCTPDNDPPAEDGNGGGIDTQGGAAGTGGSAGSGGSAGTAGTGGTSGTAGSGGTAGSAGNTSATETEAEVKAHLIAMCATAYDNANQAAFYGAATAPANWDSSMRGTIERCAFDKVVTKADITAHFADQQTKLTAADPTLGTLFADPNPTTDLFKFRVVYWTEREAGEPVLTSGSLYVPASRLIDGTKAPLVVYAHGSVGAADKCAPSREDAEGFNDDWKSGLYALAGRGWLTIIPDYIGLGTPLTYAWMSGRDEAHALLDATRATTKLFTDASFTSGSSVIVGHSQGGHAAIAAQAEAATYGLAGDLKAAVLYAPLFTSQAAWGALLTSIGGGFASGGTIASAAMYFYGHEAYMHGEDQRFSMYETDQLATITTYLEDTCWVEMTTGMDTNNDNKDDVLPALGNLPLNATGLNTLFVNQFSTDVGNCGLSANCASSLGTEWRAQWVLDRPAVDKSIPIVYWAGNKDATISPGRHKCGMDRLCGTTSPGTDCPNADLTICVDAAANHSGVVATASSWVDQYLKEKLLGAPAPAACSGESALADHTCDVPPTNSVVATDP